MKLKFYSLSIIFLVIFSLKSIAWPSPAITAPSNGSNAWVGVTLDWNAVVSTEYYQLQVDTSASFNSPVLYSVDKYYISSSSSNTDTYQYMTDLFFGKKYYWRVRAVSGADFSAWVQQFFYTIGIKTEDICAPNGTITWTGTSVNWAPHPGVDFYDLQADTSSNFNSPALVSVSTAYYSSSDGNSDTQYYLTNLYFGKKYYWRVRARDFVDTCSWSATWNFNTVDYVTVSSPSNGTNTWTGTSVNWVPHAGISFYDLEVDTSTNFNSPALVSVSKTYITSSDGYSDTEHYLTNLYFGKKYYWRVRARNFVDTCSWSSVWNFNTVDYVNLSSPSNGSNNWAGVTVNWVPHAGVSFYDLEVDTSNLFNSTALRSISTNYITSSDGYSDTEYYLTDIYFLV